MDRLRTCAAAAALAAALAAVAPARATAAPAARCTIRDAEDWREYRSAHFVLWTDASRRSARFLVQELEKLHALVVTALFGGDVELPGRTRVVAFSGRRGFDEVGPEHAAGYAATDGAWQKTIVVAYDGRSLPAGEVVAHEIAHAVSWHHFTRQPAWFGEGLAMFVQSLGQMRPDPWRSGRLAGNLSPGVLAFVRDLRTVDAAPLLRWRGGTEGEDAEWHYGQSWLLYHYLRDRRPKDLAAFQELLASGEDPANAWLATFPELDAADDPAMTRFNHQLVAYLQDNAFGTLRFPVPELEATFEERPVRSADLHLALFRLRSPSRWPKGDAERKALVAAAVEEALREDPLQPDALALRAAESGGSVAAAVRPATVARPDDAGGWLALADALDARTDAAEKEAALRKALALAPADARASGELARFLLAAGRAKEARPHAERALDLAPWSAELVDTLSAIAFELGQCKAAVVLARRALDQYPAKGAAADALRERLARYAACLRAPPAPPGAPGAR